MSQKVSKSGQEFRQNVEFFPKFSDRVAYLAPFNRGATGFRPVGFGDGASILLCNRPCKRFGENFFLDLDCSAIYTRGMKELTNAIKRDFARYAMNCDLAMHHALEDAAGDPERMLALSKLDWCALADHFLDATTASQIKNDRYA
jgi:hypothetical protein